MNGLQKVLLSNLWRWKCGLPEVLIPGIDPMPVNHMPSYPELVETQWCEAFEKLMRARLIMGAFRPIEYFSVGKTARKVFDWCPATRMYLDRYEHHGNLEGLVDAANSLMLEYAHGTRPGRHFTSLDDAKHTGVRG